MRGQPRQKHLPSPAAFTVTPRVTVRVAATPSAGSGLLSQDPRQKRAQGKSVER